MLGQFFSAVGSAIGGSFGGGILSTILTSFTFNLGPAALQRSTLRSKINSEDFAAVPQEFLKWIYVGNKRMNGLLKRRLLESRLFANNKYLQV